MQDCVCCVAYLCVHDGEHVCISMGCMEAVCAVYVYVHLCEFVCLSVHDMYSYVVYISACLYHVMCLTMSFV